MPPENFTSQTQFYIYEIAALENMLLEPDETVHKFFI